MNKEHIGKYYVCLYLSKRKRIGEREFVGSCVARQMDASADGSTPDAAALSPLARDNFCPHYAKAKCRNHAAY